MISGCWTFFFILFIYKFLKKKIFSTMSIWKMVLKHHTNSYKWLNIILQWAKNQKKRCNLGMPHYLPRNQLIRTICTYIPELEEGGEGWWPAHIGSKGLERPYHPYHYNFSQNPWFFQLKNNHPPRKNRIQMWLITYIQWGRNWWELEDRSSPKFWEFYRKQ